MRLVPFFLFFILFSNAQNQYPKDYFRSPLDIPMKLSGNFGELRPNHFHAGFDFKTDQREGLNVYAAADGFVSRIKISTAGYGKAIYITHPNGFTFKIAVEFTLIFSFKSALLPSTFFDALRAL